MTCPCGTGVDYDACCGPWHRGGDAPTAPALMRSRYSAYARGDLAHVRRTWHPSTRPADLAPGEDVEWLRLHVVDTEDGGAGDRTGVVEFVARYRAHGRPGTLRERSEFVREDGRWYYLRGTVS